MGQIRIDIVGSFKPNTGKTFSAMTGGHADAVAQAIEWLAAEVLPAAIAHDHGLQAENAFPELGFGKRRQA
jgi:hypothetical protein